MIIFYFGDNKTSSTSFHRAEALKRLGHDVNLFNAEEALSNSLNNKFLNKFNYSTGYKFLQNKVFRWLSKILKNNKTPDLIWVDSGEYFGKKCLLFLRNLACPIILYNVDDPTGKRDGNRFNMLLKAIPYYDLCVVMRDFNVLEYKSLGAKNVIRVFRSYDEVFHRPFDVIENIPNKFKSDVAFIGTWIRHEKRDDFLIELIKNGISISIWGGRWRKSRHWNFLKQYYRGEALAGQDYVAAIQGSKICLGLLSKGNRDLHTQRSLEIPFAGGLLCAERTTEHQEMYLEGTEAVFWADAKECVELCNKLLIDDNYRENLRLKGMQRVRNLRTGNEDICNLIIASIQFQPSS